MDICYIRKVNGRTAILLKMLYRFKRGIYQFFNTLQSQIEGKGRAFHALHQIDSGQATDSAFTVSLGEALRILCIVIQFRVFFTLALFDEMRRRINTERQLHQLREDLVVCNGFS